LNEPSFYEKIGEEKGIAGKTFVIQGFGNVGYWASKFLEQDGGKITTIVEHDCAIHKEDGFNVEHAK
jgi:glutamate dehydrogenase (NAD(P)+)